ncbi:PDZ domain-containing protein [bacterium]|nr:PDZ domain-containing protein [bacterium]
MNRTSHFTLSRSSLVLFALFGLLSLAGTTAEAQYRPTTNYDNSDFGPAPMDDFGFSNQGYRPFESGRTQDRYDSVGRSSNRSRDPANSRSWTPDDSYYSGYNDFGYDNYPMGPDQLPQRGKSRSSYPGANDWESRYAPQQRNHGYEELPVPNRRNIPQPTQPVATKPAEPTLSEKIAARYADPKVVRVVQQLNQSSGESLFVEISQYIDQRHIQPTTYQQRVQSSLEHLITAVSLPSYQQAVGMRADYQSVQMMQRNLNRLAMQAQAQDLNQAIAIMRQAGQILAQGTNVNPAVASLEFVYGSLDTLDKFSMFIAPEKTGEASVGLQDNMVGIGVEIEANPQGLKILKALSGGPAAQATLQRGDIITAIDGQSVAGASLNQAVDLIAGPAGTPVKLELRRGNMVGDVTLTRQSFEVHSVADVHMESGNVGYIKLDQFAQASAKEMDDALWSLHQQGMKSLILDLRGNPGGLLTTAIELSDRFLPQGTIVSTRGRTVNDNSQEAASQANTWKVPLVVMVDHNSASASEIFAAAIQENHRGVIVGEKSYGKGTVQTLFPMKSVSSALRLTTAKFYSPDGREMAGAGVTPDVLVTTMNNDRDGEDSALMTALKVTQDPRLIDMADQVARAGKSAMRVFKIAI